MNDLPAGTENSNTGGNRRKGQFQPGDPRINRKGRPKSFDELRALGQSISHEPAMIEGKPVIVNGKIVTVTEAILRGWAMSKNPVLQQKFIEITYGKVPDELDITSKGQAIKGYVVISPDDWDKTEE